MSITAMKQAVEAMLPVSAYGRVRSKDKEQAALQSAIAALRTAIAEAEAQPAQKQEPCMYWIGFSNGTMCAYAYKGKSDTEQLMAVSHQPNTLVPLYEAPVEQPEECRNGCPDKQVCDYCQGTGGKSQDIGHSHAYAARVL